MSSVKLITKIGNDSISTQLTSELLLNYVDVIHPIKENETEEVITSSVTTVIVSEDVNERCCIHTPGSCGELTEEEITQLNCENTNVIHMHCDTRHAKATFKLASEILQNNSNTIISIDLEKDRGPYMDKLLYLSNVIFTNENYISSWIHKHHLMHYINDTSSKIRNSIFLFAYYFFQTYQHLNEIVITRYVIRSIILWP